MVDADPEGVHERIQSEVSDVIVGNEGVVEKMVVALLSGGHVLLEGVPGTGKTSLANAFTRAAGLEYSRIQMTPDLLPADITGTEVYREHTGEFERQRGPVFANFVVVDEINRATPKTQSALIEVMEERQATIGGETLSLPTPFTLVATQNPIEAQGVFDLPEAQRDRFQLKLTVDVLAPGDERELLDRFDDHPDLHPEQVDQVVDVEALLQSRERVHAVHVDDKIKQYILAIVAATREHDEIVYGASPRAAIAYMNACKARAAIEGREYVIPDDVAEMGGSVLAHRLVLSTDADLRDRTPEAVVEAVLAGVDVPRDEVGEAADGE